jgi:hypothetical protein
MTIFGVDAMNKYFLSLTAVALCAGSALAQSTPASGMSEVQTLGRLNGEALACKQMALVDRIRSHIIYEAPKTREVGETFEAATTARFLELGQKESNCTDARTMADQIEKTSQAMRAAFGNMMERKP